MTEPPGSLGAAPRQSSPRPRRTPERGPAAFDQHRSPLGTWTRVARPAYTGNSARRTCEPAIQNCPGSAGPARATAARSVAGAVRPSAPDVAEGDSCTSPWALHVSLNWHMCQLLSMPVIRRGTTRGMDTSRFPGLSATYGRVRNPCAAERRGWRTPFRHLEVTSSSHALAGPPARLRSAPGSRRATRGEQSCSEGI